MQFPWRDQKKWRDIRAIVGAPMVTIMDLDGAMARTMHPRVKPRRINDMFTAYFETKGSYKADTIMRHIVKNINTLVLEAPETFEGVSVNMLTDRLESHSYSRRQVATIIALMWYGLIDDSHFPNVPLDRYTEPSFVNVWLKQNVFALSCILNYFRRIDLSDYMFEAQRVIYRRYVDGGSPPCGEFLPMSIGDANPSDSSAALHIIGAVDTVGGSVFEKSPADEEITMLIRPECLMLLAIAPHPGQGRFNVVIGAEKMSKYAGAGSSTRFDGNHVENVPIGELRDCPIAQIAVAFVPPSSASASRNQFIRDFGTDVAQLTVGMRSAGLAPGGHVMVHNWAHGFTTAPTRLRLIQAALAACAAGMHLDFYTADRDVLDQADILGEWLHGRELADAYAIITKLLDDLWTTHELQIVNVDIIEKLVRL